MAAALIAAIRLGQVWSLVDRALETRAYLAGDALSIADMALGNSVHRFFAFAIERPELPHLAAWYQRLQGHEGYHKHIFTPVIV